MAMNIPVAAVAAAAAGRRWRNRPLILRSKPSLFLLISLSLFLLYRLSPNSPRPAPLCSLSDERFLFYAPHSGFSNQVGELKNALVIASILNRTLILPPVMDHHAVVLGSCPKFRVTEPSQLRAAVWDHILDLIRDHRYISIADIIDISSISPSIVKTLDFRVFASNFCSLSSSKSCSLSSSKSELEISSPCKSLLSDLEVYTSDCIYNVQEDCRNTIWTYQQNNNYEELDSFQPDIKLRKKKNINYVRKRKDIYKYLGPGTVPDKAKLLAFGTVFSAKYKGSESYIDIHKSKDLKIKNLLEKIEFLPFSQEIVQTGKKIAKNKINGSFICAQLRLLDGQFKNHWKSTFNALKEKLKTLKTLNENKSQINIFIMTDLAKENWTNTYLEEIDNNKMYKIHTLSENDGFVLNAAKRIKLGSVNKMCEKSLLLPDILLYVEESVCSCADLGFVGTQGSTIGENIEIMRKYNVCDL